MLLVLRVYVVLLASQFIGGSQSAIHGLLSPKIMDTSIPFLLILQACGTQNLFHDDLLCLLKFQKLYLESRYL